MLLVPLLCFSSLPLQILPTPRRRFFRARERGVGEQAFFPYPVASEKKVGVGGDGWGGASGEAAFADGNEGVGDEHVG